MPLSEGFSATALDKLGRNKEALEVLNKYREIQSAYFVDLMGQFLKKFELREEVRYKEVLIVPPPIIKIQPDDNGTWFNKGYFIDDLGMKMKSLETLNKAIEIQPDLAEAWTNKGNTLTALGRKDEARQAYNKAKELKRCQKYY